MWKRLSRFGRNSALADATRRAACLPNGSAPEDCKVWVTTCSQSVQDIAPRSPSRNGSIRRDRHPAAGHSAEVARKEGR